MLTMIHDKSFQKIMFKQKRKNEIWIEWVYNKTYLTKQTKSKKKEKKKDTKNTEQNTRKKTFMYIHTHVHITIEVN